MQSVLRKLPSDSLRAYVVWIPALFSDHRESALEATGEYVDQRVQYFWDEHRAVGETYQRSMGMDRFAWDVYFVYERGVVWHEKEAPPAPYAWMHQLWGLEEMAPRLDSLALVERVQEILP